MKKKLDVKNLVGLSLKVHLEILKKTLNSIKKKNLPTICHFQFHIAVLQYTQSRIHRLKSEIKSALSFFAGSGIIIPDPDPQHCY